MRRLVFVALAVLAAGGAWWLRKQSVTSSFGAYTDAQLQTLETGYRAATRPAPAPGTSALARREAALDAELSLAVLETERHRRLALRGLALIAVLATLGALLPGRRGGRRASGEEGRLVKAVGDPAVVLEGERHKAARLLGVALEAPPAVIDAALAAQLSAHDLGRLDGLAPDLRRVLLDRRQALQRARDLLVTGVARAPTGAAPQQ
ncbi:MAG TPA: hypothetical protein VMT11_04285 [Myxococcaceae bacterium]|nr:hypothetical protein [Myxococcaceae bacterium]